VGSAASWKKMYTGNVFVEKIVVFIIEGIYSHKKSFVNIPIWDAKP
jgi:hypothetical protein